MRFHFHQRMKNAFVFGVLAVRVGEKFAGVKALVKQMAPWLTGLGRPDSSG